MDERSGNPVPILVAIMLIFFLPLAFIVKKIGDAIENWIGGRR